MIEYHNVFPIIMLRIKFDIRSSAAGVNRQSCKTQEQKNIKSIIGKKFIYNKKLIDSLNQSN